MSDPVLAVVADIGGTNTRVALAEGRSVRADTIKRYRNADHPGIEPILQSFLRDTGAHPKAVCVDMAGPVRDGVGKMTNLDWHIAAPSLAQATGSGSRREYSYRDLLELKVIKALLDSGIRLEQVRKVFAYMKEQLGEDVASANLVIDGSNSVLVNTGEELIDLLQNGQGVLNVLPLAGVKEEVDAALMRQCLNEPTYDRHRNGAACRDEEDREHPSP